jgi:acetone carboxylase alpha subunit
VTITASGCTNGGVFHKGLFGGYPPPGWKCLYAADTDLKARMQRGEDVPASLGQAARMLADGTIRAGDWYAGEINQWSPNLKEGDLFGILYYGGCGYGDPVERAPEQVKKDIENGFLGKETARRVYGVGESSEETRRLRDEIRHRRLAESVPAEQWWKREQSRARAGEVDPLVGRMYARSARMSAALKDRYLKFWQIEAFPYTDTGLPALRYAGPTGFIPPQSKSRPIS